MQQTLETIERHADVVIEDTETADHSVWLAQRRLGIGGSDVAGIAGLSPWESPYSIWYAKVAGYYKPDNERMKWGRRLERAIGMGIAEDIGLEVEPYKKMLRSRAFPVAQVNLDLISPRGVVEVKNTGHRMGEAWDDGVPDYYTLQGMHELLATGCQAADFMCLIDGGEARHVHVERDDELIADLLTIESDFWALVEANTPPATDGSKATEEALKSRYAKPVTGSAVELPLTVLPVIAEVKQHRAAIAMAKKALEPLENQLREMLGDHEAGIVDSTTVVTCKLIEREGYTVEPTTYRALSFPKPKTTKR